MIMPSNNPHRKSRAFTLIEILIVVVILGILAALVIPQVTNAINLGRAETMATSVNQVRRMIQYHAGVADVPQSPTGYPLTIDGAWFRPGVLPDHTWTGRDIVVEVVSLAATEIYPAVKIFDPTVIGAQNGWYNTTNGEFCVRVVAQADDAETLAMFNRANAVNAPNINATTN